MYFILIISLPYNIYNRCLINFYDFFCIRLGVKAIPKSNFVWLKFCSPITNHPNPILFSPYSTFVSKRKKRKKRKIPLINLTPNQYLKWQVHKYLRSILIFCTINKSYIYIYILYIYIYRERERERGGSVDIGIIFDILTHLITFL